MLSKFNEALLLTVVVCGKQLEWIHVFTTYTVKCPDIEIVQKWNKIYSILAKFKLIRKILK